MHAADRSTVSGRFLPYQNFPPIQKIRDNTRLITMQVTMGK
jgi:hypothetical protein